MSKYINKQTIILIISCILFLIPTGIALNAFSLDKYSKLRSEAGVAYSVAWLDVEDEYNKIKNGIIAIPTPKPTPIPVQTTCDKCNGTKKVKTGDGLGTTVCPCGAACKCVKTGASPNVSTTRQIVLVTQPSTCEPCREFEQQVIPALKKRGWKFCDFQTNKVDNSHIVIVNYDKNRELVEKYNIELLPTFILIEDNKEINRFIGYLNGYGVGNFFNKKIITNSDITQIKFKNDNQ